jgi:hypothetical protein
MQTPLSSRLLYTNVNIGAHKNIILPVVLYGTASVGFINVTTVRNYFLLLYY